MYTILINQDDTVTHSVREPIMHRSSNVNTLQILVDREYISKTTGDAFNMRDFTCILEYKTPISGKYTPLVISPLDELYKDKLQYLVPITTKMTAEVGELEIKFEFVKLEMLPDGSTLERVRPIASSTITIIPVEQWSDYIADSDLDAIAQIMLTLQSKIEQEKLYAEMIHQTKADNIKLDPEREALYLTANDKLIGDEIDLSTLSEKLVDVYAPGMNRVVI